MSNPPNPVNRKALSRASIAGAVFAVIGIILFVVLWIVLGQAGVAQTQRLLVSLCLPPAIFAVLTVGYAWFTNRSRL